MSGRGTHSPVRNAAVAKGAAAVRACVREPDIPQDFFCIIVRLHLLEHLYLRGRFIAHLRFNKGGQPEEGALPQG